VAKQVLSVFTDVRFSYHTEEKWISIFSMLQCVCSSPLLGRSWKMYGILGVMCAAAFIMFHRLLQSVCFWYNTE
jgi:hypothetical protein